MKYEEIEKKLHAIKELETHQLYKAKAVFKPSQGKFVFVVMANNRVGLFGEYGGIQGYGGGFNIYVSEAVSALLAFGRITEADAHLFYRVRDRRRRERDRQDEIDKMAELAHRHGFIVQKPKNTAEKIKNMKRRPFKKKAGRD